MGNDNLYKDTYPPQSDDEISKLRASETGSDAKGTHPDPSNINLANQLSGGRGTTGSYLQNNDGNGDNSAVRTASITQEERATGAQAQGNVRQDQITQGDITTDYSISQAALEHQGAEGARDDIRNQPTFFDAIMQGLTGGFAQGIDQAFCTFGQRLGQKASHQWGITRHSSRGGGMGGHGGNHCFYPDGRCHLNSSPDNNHDGICDLCGCPVYGTTRNTAKNTIKPHTPSQPPKNPPKPPPHRPPNKPSPHHVHRPHHVHHHGRGRHRTVVIYGPIRP